MKKIICVILILAMALSFAACGKKSGGENGTPGEDTGGKETSAVPNDGGTIKEGDVIYDEEDIKVVYTGFEYADEDDEKIYAQFSFDVTNNRSEDIFFRITNMCINGIMNIGNTYVIVRAGKQITEPVSIWKEEMNFFNVEKIADIKVDMVLTSANGLDVFKEDITVKTGQEDPSYQQKYEFEGEQVIDNEYITVYFVGKSGDEEKSYCDMVIYNKTDKMLRVTPYNARINSEDKSNWVFSNMERSVVGLKPHTYTFTYIAIMNSAITDLGIKDIEYIRYQLDVYDYFDFDETGTKENVPLLTTEDIVIK